MSWDEICGEHVLMAIRTDVNHPFQSDANGVALDMKTFVLFAFEDPNDGYRSCCAAPMIAKGASLFEFGCDPEYICAPVIVRRWIVDEHGQAAEGVEFVDKRNDKVLLQLGTSNSNDYYPSFVCDWRPQNLADNALP